MTAVAEARPAPNRSPGLRSPGFRSPGFGSSRPGVGGWSDRSRLTAANLVSQVLLGLSVLVVARLYDPGVFALFVAVDAVLQVVANVPAIGLERGLARAPSPGSYVRILRTSLLVAVLSPALLVVPVALNVARTASPLGAGPPIGELVLLGVALAATRGVLFVLRYHGVVSRQLGAVVRLELVGAALLLVARSGLGFLVGTAQALLLAATVAGLATTVIVGRGLRLTPGGVADPDRRPDPGGDAGSGPGDPGAEGPLRTMAIEGPIAVLQRIPTHGLPIIVGLAFDAERVALLALAALVTFRPVSVAARATADLALASLAAHRRAWTDEPARPVGSAVGRPVGSDADPSAGRTVGEAVRMTMVMSVALLVVISGLASLASEVVLGAAWRGVGPLTWALLPLNVATIVAVPIQHALTVAGRGRLRLASSAAMAVVVGATVGLGPLIGLGLHGALVVAGLVGLIVVAALVGPASRPGKSRRP